MKPERKKFGRYGGSVIHMESVFVVLVEPSLAENVGAAARAMRNMGFPNLRLVDPEGEGKHLAEAAHRMSAGAGEILERAEVYPTVEQALADLHLTVGCTARCGKGRPPLLDPKGLPAYLKDYRQGTRIGIVFGREDRGLTTQELDCCSLVLTIPTVPEHSSLNLAQAVLIVCYELAQSGGFCTRLAGGPASQATSEELEGLFRQARDVLLRIGFLHPENPDRILRVLRRILGRARPNSREVQILRGILRQIAWVEGKARGPGESRPPRE